MVRHHTEPTVSKPSAPETLLYTRRARRLTTGLLTGLREGVEASLIVSIILAYLGRTGNQRHFGRIWLGSGVAVAANRGAPAYRQHNILQLLRDIAEIGIDDLTGQDFVAGADDFDLHVRQAMKLRRRPGSGHCMAPSWPEAERVM